MIINKRGDQDLYLERMESTLPENLNFYWFDFNNGEIKKVISEAPKLLQQNVNILLDCCMEGFKSILTTIYEELVITSNIPEDRIYLMSGATDIKEFVLEAAQKYNKKPIYADWMREFEQMIASQLKTQMNIDRTVLDTVHDRVNRQGFEKSFISLNRRWRMHRPVLVAMLAKRDLLKRGFVSLTETEHPVNWTHTFNSILATHQNDIEIYDYFLNNQEYISSLTPLSIDKPSLRMNGLFNLSNDLNYYYANSYFSVVTETNFYTDPNKYNSTYISICEATRFLSEKTFKPMVYKHPFLLVSVPNMLSLLKDIGYKTFHPYIDESYDSELDDGKRMIKVLNEIEKLCWLNEKDLAEFLNNVAPICDHNFNVLLERYKTLFPKVQNLYF